MNNCPNIFIIGPMGSGKTTIGRSLARSLGLRFYDADHEIEARSGAPIPWIFDIEGEKGFRKREQSIIEELTNKQNIVLATGGGAVVTPENRTMLAARGFVVYLKVSIEKQLARTEKSTNRPLLQAPDKKARLQQLSEQREAFYQEIADLEVDTDIDSITTIVKQIVKQVRNISNLGES